MCVCVYIYICQCALSLPVFNPITGMCVSPATALGRVYRVSTLTIISSLEHSLDVHSNNLHFSSPSSSPRADFFHRDNDKETCLSHGDTKQTLTMLGNKLTGAWSILNFPEANIQLRRSEARETHVKTKP